MTSGIAILELRDIGWGLWDPIGLLPMGKTWHDDDCQHFADEYDVYLIEVADLLRRGVLDYEAVHYLATIETEHMGLGEHHDTVRRAELVVAAISLKLTCI